jgi:hypothetical protein
MTRVISMRTSSSEPARPSTNTLVESHTIASRPSSPSLRMAGISVAAPVIGASSNFQSPVWKTVPSSVRMARPFGSAIECVRVI